MWRCLISHQTPKTSIIIITSSFLSQDLLTVQEEEEEEEEKTQTHTYFFDSLLRGGIRASFHRILGL